MKHLKICMTFIAFAGFISDYTCSCEIALKKIDRLARKYYKSAHFTRQVIENSETYEIQYYHKKTILGGGIEATIRKKDCKIICLILSQ